MLLLYRVDLKVSLEGEGFIPIMGTLTNAIINVTIVQSNITAVIIVIHFVYFIIA